MTVTELRIGLETMPGDYEVVFPDTLPLLYLVRDDEERRIVVTDEAPEETQRKRYDLPRA